MNRFCITFLWLMLLTAGIRADVSPKTRPVFRPDRAKLLREFDLGVTVSMGSQSTISGNGAVCAAELGTDVRFYSTLTGKFLSKAETGIQIHDSAFSHDGSQYAIANHDGKVRLFRTSDGKKLNEFDVGGEFS